MKSNLAGGTPKFQKEATRGMTQESNTGPAEISAVGLID
jgi:hypothetical protein